MSVKPGFQRSPCQKGRSDMDMFPSVRSPRSALNSPSLQRLQKLDEIVDLIGLEPKLGHARMSGDDALAERLFQRRNRVTLVQRAERRRDLERTFAELVDRVATGAIGAGDVQAALRAGGQRRQGGSTGQCEHRAGEQ